MYYIAQIEIEGFQGNKKPMQIHLNPAVNFIIGRNGTGKTRLMNLLNAIITTNFRVLSGSSFTATTLKLVDMDRDRQMHIEVVKNKKENGEVQILYHFRNPDRRKPTTFKLEDRSEFYLHFARLSGSLSQEVRSPNESTKLNEYIRRYISLSWLSVNRGTIKKGEDGQQHETPVDAKLIEVSRDFGTYFSTLDKSAAEANVAFQRLYFLSLLYSDRRAQSFHNAQELDYTQERAALSSIFSEFRMPESEYQEKLDDHFERYTDAVASYSPQTPVDSSQFLVMMDTLRIHEIIQEWNQLTARRKQIYEPKDNFIKIVNHLFFGKELAINNGNQPIFKRDDIEIPLLGLSSGEKQLFIILGETLLQQQRPCVFLADEPELSLHLDWQMSLVPSLRDINPRSQIIFATHSPDIVGAYQTSTIDLEKMF